MIVSISQPCYLGWCGYFDRIEKSDLHICLDHVQLEKGGFTNRTQIMQPDGRVMWLTIPVEKGKPINETRVTDGGWIRKHKAALRQAYGLTFHYSTHNMLTDHLYPTTRRLLEELGLHPSVLLSSRLGGERLGAKSDLVLNLCREVGATVYLSGVHGRDYLNLPSFEKVGIEVHFHEYPIEQPVLSALHYLYGGDRRHSPV